MIEPKGDSVYFAGGLLAAGVGPSLAVVMVAHGKLQDSVEELQAAIERDYKNRLY